MPTGCYPRESLFDRIIMRVVFTPDDCWEWQGGLSHGYGRVGINNKTVSTHRAMYEILKGPIRQGMFLCHKCDNPKCCNPDHLFEGTQLDNMQDCKSKGRNKPPPNKKLNSLQVEEIRSLYVSGMGQKEIANKFNITQSNVSKIVTGASRSLS